MDVSRQVMELTRGCAEVIAAEELERKLAKGKPLRIKAGFDPTAPDIHLGHTVVLQVMRRFQQLGHEVIFLIGDYTATIGDPSGRSGTRPALTRDEVLANAETYKAQVHKVLDPDQTVLRFNSEWFAEMSLSTAIEKLASQWTVARMLERDDFAKRFREHRPIALHEFLYPLIQGYDSIALGADVEIGGTDQKFNLLVGRDLQRAAGLEPQAVLMVPLLEGLDGVNKMSKSLDNYIGISEPPGEQFGKVMSISDELMWRYYELLSDLSNMELETRIRMVTSGDLHPKAAKVLLAKEVVARFHGSHAAETAAAEFELVHVQRELPEDMPSESLECGPEGISLLDLLDRLGLVSSRSEARRFASQGGLRLDGQKVADVAAMLLAPAELVVQLGKRRFCRVTLLPSGPDGA